MEERKPNVCIAVLCGIPGSGKTHLCRKLVQQSMQTNRLFIHVCFDELLPQHVEKLLIETEAEDNLWKKYRQGIISLVDELIGCLRSHHHNNTNKTECVKCYCGIHQLSKSLKSEDKTSPGEIQAAQQHDNSHLSADCVVDELSNNLQQRFFELITKSLGVCKAGPFVILIDDNMYYRSMRYHIYQLARRYEVGFCQVYCKCNVDVAVFRNSCRDSSSRVLDDIVDKMASVLHVPGSSGEPWEEYSICLNTEQSEDSSGMSQIDSLISEAMNNPVTPCMTAEELASRELDRDICSSNEIHQVDQTLRKHIAQRISMFNGTVPRSKADIRTYAAALSSVKERILKDFKQGRSLRNVLKGSGDSVENLTSIICAVFDERVEQISLDIENGVT